MNRTPRKDFRLDITVELGQFLLAGDYLDRIQELLREHAPKWSARLHVWRYREEKTPVDVSTSGTLKEAVRLRAAERGPLFFELERRYGRASPARVFGDAELHGADDSLILIVSLDEAIFRRAGDKWLWGNHIALQVCRAKVDGTDSVTWSARLFNSLCSALSPAYAHAEMKEEYEHKNISHEGGSTMAVGVDLSKALPGLYWLNFLGKPYRDLIGRERLLSSPGYEVYEVDEGVLLSLDRSPEAWKSTEYQAAERSILTHVGPQYFFSKERPFHKTIAPDFGLSTD